MSHAAAAFRLAALAAFAGALSGCVMYAPTLDPVRRELEGDLPGVHFSSEVQFRLGRLSLALGRAIARAVVDDPEEREVIRILRHVKRVEVAVYETDDLGPEARLRWPRTVRRLSQRTGWRVAARFRDQGALGSVLYQERDGAIRSVYVFVLDDESLVLARLQGRLDEAIADALARTGKDLPQLLAGERARPGRQPEAEAAPQPQSPTPAPTRPVWIY